MRVIHASATRETFQPVVVGLPEKPKPGLEGITRWKASPGSPPWATGSVGGPIRCRNSRIEPGRPWHSSSGTAPGQDYLPFQSADLRADGGSVSLPPRPGAGRLGTVVQAVISFGPGGEPVLGVLDDSPFRLAAYRNVLLSALRFQLHPVFKRRAEYQKQTP